MKVLDLFCGSKSVGRFCEENGYEVITLDVEKKWKPTICIDILDWDYTTYVEGEFDIIWASPECKVFSQLQTTNIGRNYTSLQHLNEVREQHSVYILRAIDIIKYLKPKYYFIENPIHSKIWNYVPSEFLYNYVDVDYCMFGFPYRKRTRILTNKQVDDRLCSRKKHDYNIGYRGAEAKRRGHQNDPTQEKHRYMIPEKLIEYLLK